ncbi:Hypothetical protein CINCED_3A006504 [Cinara cedri]|uniref:Protein Jumonji n=1 Tax=Cinara cedri TaxID=506608 RepID=A0A5E4MIX0_9HEMI|nr:Hypothetical protein CINCED_3A006504 [Cinara cedri]
MSSSKGIDPKKRKLLTSEEALLEASTKKIKVQAQRKFAQNAVTPTSTPQKLVQTPIVPNNPIKPPIKRPNTEDFLTFLCFRGTSLLPPRLDFFNKPQRSLSAQEISAGKKRRKSTPILPASSSNKNVNESNERKNIRQLPQTKYSLTKLGQKVIGRNLVRCSSRYSSRQESLTLRQIALHHGSKIKKPKPKPKVKKVPVVENVKKELKKSGKQVSLDGKQIQKLKGRITRSNSVPSIFYPAINQLRDDKGKWIKGNVKPPSSKSSEDFKDSKDVEEERPSRKKTVSKNLDYSINNSGNLKRKTSENKCKVVNKNERKTRSLVTKHKSDDQDNYVVPDKNLRNVLKINKANSLIETKCSSDVKRRTASVDNMKTIRAGKDSISSTRSRPPRRTKEAATLFMEMLRKDMRCPDEQEEDETSSVESFPDLPNTRINEQRERELKGFSKKHSIHNVQQAKQSLFENNDDQCSLIMAENKKTVVDKKTVKEKKKVKTKTSASKMPKEVTETIAINDDGGTSSFKRNLRPRRSSTMLDDYIIMTDSEEDFEKPEPVTVPKKWESSKPIPKTTTTAEDPKSQKIKFSTEESAKKNLKINKTDLKPKKDLSKIDSEVIKKSLSETKSKNTLVKRHKELVIKNNKNTAADKKIEKSSKNKTESPIVVNVEPKTTGESSKNSGKKVPLSNKQQQLARKENASNKKKSTLDLYNNNNYNNTKKSSTVPSSVTTSSSMFNSTTSQTKEELLERMAKNFEVKPTVCRLQDDGKATKKPTTITSTKVENNSAVVEKKIENGKTMKKSSYSAVTVDRKIKNSAVIAGEKKAQNAASSMMVSGGTDSALENQQDVNNEAKGKMAASDTHPVKLELKVSKTENVQTKEENVQAIEEKVQAKEEKVQAKEENVQAKEENMLLAGTGKMENLAVVVKVDKAESTLMPYCDTVQKLENVVFQSLTKDLFLQDNHKDIKIAMPEYLSGNNFQLSNRFKQDDGLSVLSEICSALPRFNEPFVSNRQHLFNNKLPVLSADSDFVKHANLQHTPTLVPVPLAVGVLDPKKTEKPSVFPPSTLPPPPPPQQLPPPQPPSFESRTVKIVNLARGNNSAVAGTCNDKKDVGASWKQSIKDVKLQKNGLLSGAAATIVAAAGSNSLAWGAKRKQPSNDDQTVPPKTPADIVVDDTKNNKTATAGAGERNSGKQPAVWVNGVTEKKSSVNSCQKTCCGESKPTEMFDSVKKTPVVNSNSSYLAKTTILNSTKYDLKFEKRSTATVAVPIAATTTTATPVSVEKHHRKDVVGDVSSSDDQSPEKKIFNQRRLSTNQSCSGNSSDAFSPDNETSVYAFQPDLPVASTPFRRNKPHSPAKSRTVSPNTSIAVNFENDSTEEKSHQSAVSSTTDVDSEDGRLFYIPLPAGVQAQPLIQGVTVKLGTEGPQNKLVMSAKLVTKPPASTIPISSISPKTDRKIKPLCSTKITNSTTPVGTVQPTTRSVQPPKCSPSTSKEMLPLQSPSQPQLQDEKDEKKRLQKTTTTNTTATTTSTVKEFKKSSISSSSPASTANNKKSKKTEKHIVNNKRKSSEKVASKKKLLREETAEMVEAPTFYPSEEDFKDPLEYFEIIKPVAQKYGICRVVPPPSFKPECKVSDDMRFTAYNQYVHKMMNRWGPNVREMMAMKKYLKTQSIMLSNPPLIGGMELDLPRLYHTVQELGGLKEVIELDKWSRVADLMKIPKSAQDRVTKLDDIYCKYLLPYDTLSHEERQKLITEVDKEWKQICKKGGDTEDELYDDVNDCITKGRSIALSAYYRVARNTVAMWFREQQQQPAQGGGGGGNSSITNNSKLAAAAVRAEDVETSYWKHVQDKKNHICVLSGSIDSGTEGYGFPTAKTATFTKHPWNLKVLTNNPVSVLKSLGPVMGMTVPTIHMGMVFSACCWYKDPHGLPWIEYLHTGADKVWYGVPCARSDQFRTAMKRLLPRAVAEGENHHTWLAADSGMVPPGRLLEHGVPLTRTVQNPGQFLIVMPRAYTCNVSTGYVISESVYFTQSGWLNDAERIFQELQRNCEPAAFSFEKLLINMSTDSRTPHKVLKQLLNILSNTRDCEVALRSQLVEDLGLKSSERIRVPISKSSEQIDDYECDVCHSILYISMVNNSHDDCDYCLRHGIEILSKKHNQLKYCKFMYTFDEAELDSILVKLRERIDSKKKKTSAKS